MLKIDLYVQKLIVNLNNVKNVKLYHFILVWLANNTKAGHKWKNVGIVMNLWLVKINQIQPMKHFKIYAIKNNVKVRQMMHVQKFYPVVILAVD